MKRFLLALALLGPLASCSKKDDPTVTTTTSQSSMLVGTWNLTSSRLQKTNSDVTTTITDRQRIFNADGSYVFIVQNSRSTGTYVLTGSTLVFDGGMPGNQVLELTAKRLVLTFTDTPGTSNYATYTNTYTR